MATSGWSAGEGPRARAGNAFVALDQLVPASRRAIDAGRWTVAAGAVAATLGWTPEQLRPMHHESVAEVDADEAVVVRSVAEQFVVDVTGLASARASDPGLGLGRDAFAVLQVIWVLDWATRADAAWPQLFGPVDPGSDDPRPGADSSGSTVDPDGAELWPAMEDFMATVARLDALDPVTTELVRLRGARAHDCRLCRSRRYVQAVQAGADEGTFDQIDDYEHSRLDPRQQVALRLTDALVWTPIAYPDGLVAQVRQAFSPTETVELVLDVVRNSANKIAVALGADQAQVPDGQVEYYDIDPDGQVRYGLSPT